MQFNNGNLRTWCRTARWGKIKNHWCMRFLVFISEECTISFHDCLEKFIRRVLITDFVLSFINAFELMMLHKSMDKLEVLKQQKTALNILRDFMIFKSITVIEHKVFFCSASSNHKPHFKLFRFKQIDEDFISNDELSRELGPNYISACSQLTYKADIRIATETILERRNDNLMFRNTLQTEPSIMIEPTARMKRRFFIDETY